PRFTTSVRGASVATASSGPAQSHTTRSARQPTASPYSGSRSSRAGCTVIVSISARRSAGVPMCAATEARNAMCARSAVPTGVNRLGRDLAHEQVIRIVEEVHVEVGVHAEGGGQSEYDADMLDAVAVVVRAAADEVGAQRERAAQQPLGARRLHEPFLREGAE